MPGVGGGASWVRGPRELVTSDGKQTAHRARRAPAARHRRAPRGDRGRARRPRPRGHSGAAPARKPIPPGDAALRRPRRWNPRRARCVFVCREHTHAGPAGARAERAAPRADRAPRPRGRRRRQHTGDPRLGAAPRRPLLCRPRGGHRRRADAGARRERRPPRRAAPARPLPSPHRTRRVRFDRRPRGRRPPARGRGPRRLRRARLRRVRALVRGGRAGPRPSDRPVPAHRRAPHVPAGAYRGRRRDRGRDHARAAALSRPSCPMRFYLPHRRRRRRAGAEPDAQLLPVQGRGVLLVGARARGRGLELRAAAAGRRRGRRA